MIDRLINTPEGARVVTYQESDVEFDLMCAAFERKGLKAEDWRYVFTMVGGQDREAVVHYFARPDGELWCKIPENPGSEGGSVGWS